MLLKSCKYTICDANIAGILQAGQCSFKFVALAVAAGVLYIE
jgi:hypothetical protein